MMANRPTIDVQNRICFTEDGLHLADSILWFDSLINGELSFLSSAQIPQRQPRVRVIATEETTKILEVFRKRSNALICQYNRPFSIGRLSMELLPSGIMLGSASMYLENEDGSVLYVPQIQTEKIPTVRKAQTRKAKTLILGANHANPNLSLPNRKKEKERLLATVNEFIAKGEFPTILCDPNSTAQELTHLFSQEAIPVAAQNLIFRLNRIYENYGIRLGKYSLLSPKRTKNKVVIYPFEPSSFRTNMRNLPEGPIIVVSDTFNSTEKPIWFPKEICAQFILSSSCDGPQLKEIVAKIKPEELYIFGVYTKSYVNEFKTLCANIYPLFQNDQPTLF